MSLSFPSPLSSSMRTHWKEGGWWGSLLCPLGHWVLTVTPRRFSDLILLAAAPLPLTVAACAGAASRGSDPCTSSLSFPKSFCVCFPKPLSQIQYASCHFLLKQTNKKTLSFLFIVQHHSSLGVLLCHPPLPTAV